MSSPGSFPLGHVTTKNNVNMCPLHSSCAVDSTGAVTGGLVYWAFINDPTCGGGALTITYDGCGTQQWDTNVYYDLRTCPWTQNFSSGSTLHVGAVLLFSVLGALFSFCKRASCFGMEGRDCLFFVCFL